MLRPFEEVNKYRGRIKEVTLLFFLGFFVGGILFYFFSQSFRGILTELDSRVGTAFEETIPFFQCLIYIIFENSKPFVLLWILCKTKLVRFYMVALIVYKGFVYGFLATFFFMERGMRGLLFILAYLFPQTFFLLPAYLLSMAKIYNSRQENPLPAALIFYALLLFGCFMEAKFNLPLMSSLYVGN